MAVPIKQLEAPEQRPPASKLGTWTRKNGAALGRPVLAVILALIVGAIVILITWPDKTVDPFTNIINAYSSLFSGSFGSLASISVTLVKVTLLIFVSLSVAIAFRAGLFNIGAAGQLVVGAMTADMIGFTFTYTTDVGLFFALIALVIYWFIISRTTFGYELRVIGQNPKAAKYAGIPIKRNIFLVMAIAGAFAGLAGSVHLMGQPGYELSATAFSTDPTGFDGIAVALLGGGTAIGVLLSALLLGGLRSGTTAMQAIAHVDPNLVLIIEALVLFFIAIEFIPALRRVLPGWLRLGRRPTLETATVGKTSVDLPENDNGGAQNGVDITDIDNEE